MILAGRRRCPVLLDELIMTAEWDCPRSAGDVGGQIFEAGLVDEVALDVVPVVFGTGKRYFGRLSKQVLLEDPDEVVQGARVLHLRFRVRK